MAEVKKSRIFIPLVLHYNNITFIIFMIFQCYMKHRETHVFGFAV